MCVVLFDATRETFLVTLGTRGRRERGFQSGCCAAGTTRNIDAKQTHAIDFDELERLPPLSFSTYHDRLVALERRRGP